MPTFRNDVKLGTKVPLIQTDDLADKCVTAEKIVDGTITANKLVKSMFDGIEDKLKDGSITTEKLADGAVTAEKLSEKYLPLKKGGTIGAGAPTTTLEGGNIILEGVFINTHKPGPFIKKSVEITEKSITGTSSDTTDNTFQINENGIAAKKFVTKDQSVQGLLANNGDIAIEMSDAEIDGLFE